MVSHALTVKATRNEERERKNNKKKYVILILFMNLKWKLIWGFHFAFFVFLFHVPCALLHVLFFCYSILVVSFLLCVCVCVCFSFVLSNSFLMDFVSISRFSNLFFDIFNKACLCFNAWLTLNPATWKVSIRGFGRILFCRGKE